MGVYEFAKALTNPMLECRDYGHAWMLDCVTVLRFEYTVSGYVRDFVCARGCGTRRKQHLDHLGEIAQGGSHSYDGDYLYPGGRLDHTERSVIRLETNQRRLNPA